jgi:hypothetical protein
MIRDEVVALMILIIGICSKVLPVHKSYEVRIGFEVQLAPDARAVRAHCSCGNGKPGRDLLRTCSIGGHDENLGASRMIKLAKQRKAENLEWWSASPANFLTLTEFD